MEIRIGRTGDCQWAVWLDEKMVALFNWVGDALDYAELLGVSPRERAAAVAIA